MSREPQSAPAEHPTPPRPPVSIKGSGSGLRILVTRAPSSAVEASLKQQLEARAGSFFADAGVSLEMPGRTIDFDLAQRLARLVEAAGMQVDLVRGGASKDPDARSTSAGNHSPTGQAALPDGEVAALVVGHSLRSGQRVAHAGSVIVLGDVNPGAEVIAGESVIVWGRLRGIVEAGLAREEDDPLEDIVVCSLDLAPTQLRIGSAIARAPDEPDRVPQPETARAEDGRIVVDTWR